MKIKRGSTSVRMPIFVADSSSTVGAGLTGLTHGTSGLVWYYFAGDLADEASVSIVTATLGSYTSGGFIVIDGTNMPGWYEIGIPNAALDGGTFVAMQLRGATNMVPVNVFIELDSSDVTEAAKAAYRAKTVYFVSTAGNTANDGLTPLTAKALPSQALALASAGDVVVVAAGTYDQVTTSVVVPTGVSLIGAGWQTTIINSQVANPTSICKPGTNSLIQGLTFYGNLATDVAQRGMGLGTAETAFTNAVVRDCYIYGNADGVQLAKAIAGNNCSIKFYDCVLVSGFDALAISLANIHTVEFYDCEFNADVSLVGGYTTSGVICRGIVNSNSSTISAYNCRYRAVGASATNSGIQNSSGGTINVYGSRGFDCDLYDIERTAGTVNVYAASYDTAKVSGIVNVYPSPANLTLISGQTATATEAISVDKINDISATADIASALASVSNVILTQPYQGGELDIYRANQYRNASGTAIAVTKTSSETHWPTTLSTVHFSAVPTTETLAATPTAESLLNVSCTVTASTGASQSFYVELTSAQTDGLTLGVGAYEFTLVANKATYPIVLRGGSLTVRKQLWTTASG